MSLCVYALIPSSQRRAALSTRPVPRGVAGERISGIRVGRLTAIVGELTRAPRPTRENLRRYNAVLTSLWNRTSALLPVRFGSVVGDAAELDALLSRDRQQVLRRQLAAVRGRGQMTVRILISSDAKSQPPTADSQSSGRAYLLARASRNNVPEFAPLRRAVRRWVRAERVEKRDGVATVYHLVSRGASDRYRRALEHAAAAAGTHVIVTGPWPPYAFADGAET